MSCYSWNSTEYSKSAALQENAATELISALAVQSTEKVLDLGCGIGNLTLELGAIACQGEVVGVDTSPSMIEQAKRNLQATQLPNVRFLVASVIDLPTDATFDVVFSNSVLHWVNDQRQLLRAVRRLLSNNGRMGLQFPLLNADHPLISVSQKAIQTMGLESRYASWPFPWYVPESPSSYAHMLRELSFGNVHVTQRETTFCFGSASAALGFFDAVGLPLFQQPLFPDEATAFKDEVRCILAGLETETGVRFDFSRLYICASV